MTVSIRAADGWRVVMGGCIATAALLSLGKVHAQGAVIESTFINADAPYPESHASTIVEMAPDVVAAAWFGGTNEGHPDVGIWFARREAGRWMPAREIVNGVQSDGSRFPTWNPVLFQPSSDRLLLFYKAGPSPSGWWGMVMTSADAGKSWGAPRRLPAGILGPIKNKPVVLADGTWLAGSSTEDPSAGWQVHFELSRDSGQTWKKIGPVSKGPGLDAIQPSILFHRNGGLQAVGRTRQGVNFQTWSRDGGNTWTPLTAIDLPNPNSGTDAITLRDGRQLLVYNHAAHHAEQATGNRFPLDIAVSCDGVRWTRVLTLETQPLVSGYAYPAVIQTADGLVHVTYTWDRKKIKHVTLDPTKLSPERCT
jgi:predicted neuraminidase